MYIFKSYGPLTEIKLREHSVAIAFARRVFPVPGGPKNRSPDRGAMPDAKSYGWANGNCIVSRISCFAACKPPTSYHLTAGTLAATSELDSLWSFRIF